MGYHNTDPPSPGTGSGVPLVGCQQLKEGEQVGSFSDGMIA
jgi:hypothetical protein